MGDVIGLANGQGTCTVHTGWLIYARWRDALAMAARHGATRARQVRGRPAFIAELYLRRCKLRGFTARFYWPATNAPPPLSALPTPPSFDSFPPFCSTKNFCSESASAKMHVI